MKEKFGDECAQYCINELAFEEDVENLKSSDFYLLNAKKIADVANNYFKNPSKVEDVKAAVALFWLTKINEINYKLS